MQTADFSALAPLLVLTAAIAIIMLQIAIRRSHGGSEGLALAGLAAAVAAIGYAAPHVPVRVTPLLILDTFGLSFMALILVATGATSLLSGSYLARLDCRHCGEFHLLLLMAALGGCVLVVSANFIALFLGLEILSISLYTLIAYPRERMESLEAGLKYLILAAAASSFLLFGIALIYMNGGTLDFTAFTEGLQRPSLLMLAGTAMLILGFGFKLALVPFHMWTPDVYQGAPAPATALVATVSKISMAALLLRLFTPLDPAGHPALYQLLGVLAFVSMVGGNLLALRQDHVKRILAYSSIAHVGYLLVAFMAGGRTAVASVSFYLLAYAVSIMGCFAVVTVLSQRTGDADHLSAYQGLFWRHPWLGTVFALMLLSLAGIPLTAGFVGKFILVAAGAGSSAWFLVFTLVVTSGVGLFYYLRIIVVMVGGGQTREADPFIHPEPAVGVAAGIVLAATTTALILLGVVPGHLIDFIRYMMTMGYP